MTLSGAVRLAAATAMAGVGVFAAGAMPAAAASGPIQCKYVITNIWSGGFMADLYITNTGPAINGWTARWSFTEPTSRIQGWSAQLTQDGSSVTAVNMPWNGTIGTGMTASFGWSAVAQQTSVPTDI